VLLDLDMQYLEVVYILTGTYVVDVTEKWVGKVV
jgi:hypothetical protein